MRKCGAMPYEGDEKYIFVSYCHRDSAEVFPIIEQMAKDGYRVWYDEGINPGNDWPEIIADHLNRCSVCIAFISENAMDSHDCGREINYALLKKKTFFSVYLEEVELSAGLEMQLTTTQSIFKYKYSDFKSFIQKLYKGNGLKECRDASAADLNDNDNEENIGESNSDKEKNKDEKKKKRLKRVLLITIPAVLVCCGIIAAIIILNNRSPQEDDQSETTAVETTEISTTENIVESTAEATQVLSTVPSETDVNSSLPQIELVSTEGDTDLFKVDGAHIALETTEENGLNNKRLNINDEYLYHISFDITYKFDRSESLFNGVLYMPDGSQYNNIACSDNSVWVAKDDLVEGTYTYLIETITEQRNVNTKIKFKIGSENKPLKSITDNTTTKISSYNDAMDFDVWGNVGKTIEFMDGMIRYEEDQKDYVISFEDANGSFQYDLAPTDKISFEEYKDKLISGKAIITTKKGVADSESVAFEIIEVY